jgi:methionyl-tRNA synthetase
LMEEAPKAMIEQERPKEVTKAKENKKTEASKEESVGLITFDEFFNTTLKIGTIVEAEEVPKSKKLLKLQVDIGEDEHRQIVAGIKDYYSSLCCCQP